jgi:mannose-6-phosphate isomerase-like protein (cupin superfamily)
MALTHNMAAAVDLLPDAPSATVVAGARVAPTTGPQPILASMVRRVVTEDNGVSLDFYRLGFFDGNFVDLSELTADTYYAPHIHREATAKVRVLVGTGSILLDGVAHEYRAGDCFDVPAGVAHGFRVRTQTVLVSVQDRAIYNEATGHVDLYPGETEPRLRSVRPCPIRGEMGLQSVPSSPIGSAPRPKSVRPPAQSEVRLRTVRPQAIDVDEASTGTAAAPIEQLRP